MLIFITIVFKSFAFKSHCRSIFKMNSPFTHKNVRDSIQSSIQNNNIKVEQYLLWLQKTPKISTYRINHLQADVDVIHNVIQEYLEQQTKLYQRKHIPRVYKIFPETIAIESWHEEELDKTFSTGDKPQVIVDVVCGAAVLRGSHVFAPGVMGLPTDIKLNDEVDIYADLSGKCKKGLKTKYDGTTLLIGRGRLKMLRHQLYGENLIPRGVAVENIMPRSGVPVIDNDLLPKGSCLLQNLPSIICSKVLDPKPGETILDMCASPGNKTSHLAEIMNDKGYVIAIDKSIPKVDTIRNRCKESGITCVHPFVYDSTKAVIKDDFENFTNDIETVLKGPPFLPETFDRILLDVPCSALGQRPLLKNSVTLKILQSYVPLQRNLFITGMKLLKKSGRLVYSTCTITREECEMTVAWALKTFPNLSLVPAEPVLGGPGWTDCGLSDAQRFMVQRFGPGHDDLRPVDPAYNDTLGFFIACFEKN